jgi:alanine racemase
MRSDLLAQINTDDLLHNYHALKACCRPGVKLCAPLKADAYGHSMAIVAPVLYEAGADMAAVATLFEAMELRDLGWDRPILVLGNVLGVADAAERGERLGVIEDHRLSITIADGGVVDYLSRQRLGAPIDVHLKVDTGMGRMGVLSENAAEVLRHILRTPQIHLAGVYSHFATADFEDVSVAERQVGVFRRFLDEVRAELPAHVTRHLANSAATIALPDAHFDMVRPGLALYGYYPSRHMRGQIDLRPILRVVTHLTAMKKLPKGHGVGYGRTFVTSRPTRLGIIPAGYSDGFLRMLSNNMIVGTASGDAPVVGRVSMDQLAVDLSDLSGVGVGDEVVLLDNDGDRPNGVDEVALRLGTISYEVTCLLGRRIDRMRVGKSCAGYRPLAARS